MAIKQDIVDIKNTKEVNIPVNNELLDAPTNEPTFTHYNEVDPDHIDTVNVVIVDTEDVPSDDEFVPDILSSENHLNSDVPTNPQNLLLRLH